MSPREQFRSKLAGRPLLLAKVHNITFKRNTFGVSKIRKNKAVYCCICEIYYLQEPTSLQLTDDVLCTLLQTLVMRSVLVC